MTNKAHTTVKIAFTFGVLTGLAFILKSYRTPISNRNSPKTKNLFVLTPAKDAVNMYGLLKSPRLIPFRLPTPNVSGR